MQTITGTILALSMALLASCVSETGRPGRDGLDGKDGDSFLGAAFEIAVDFTPENNYSHLFEFPETFEIYNSDVVLVYLLWEQSEDTNGDPVDIWRMLPQTVLINDLVLQYNYDYTFVDVKLFLEGTIPFNELLPAETNNQIIRIVVLPADFVTSAKVDLTDLPHLMESLQLTPDRIRQTETETETETESTTRENITF